MSAAHTDKIILILCEYQNHSKEDTTTIICHSQGNFVIEIKQIPWSCPDTKFFKNKYPNPILIRKITSILQQGRNQLFISGGGSFMKFHSMTSSCLFNRGTTFSQTVTYNDNVFLPADTKSIVYKHTHSALRWLIKTDKTERFTTALEAESPMSSEISDFTPYAHVQSNIQHIKHAEKTDD